MKWLNALRQTSSTRHHAIPHQSQAVQRDFSFEPPPQNFEEAIGYLAWYLKRLPDYRLQQWPEGKPCYVPLCQRYLMAWLRNELIDGKLPVSVRGDEWSL